MKKLFVSMVLIVGVFVAMTGVALAVNGASTVNTVGQSSHGPVPGAGSNVAIAGNVTELDIVSSSNSQTWAGYFGNVSGTITLENGAGDVMYNWSAANPTGEVLASTGSSVTWANIACATAANITAMESTFNIPADAADNITETFTATDGAVTIAGQSLSSCRKLEVFDETGSGSADFTEVLLHDGTDPVFASILADDALGFDNNAHDFEMLVLEDGHGTDTSTTNYYFYVELN
jgi:hypothetical protein